MRMAGHIVWQRLHEVYGPQDPEEYDFSGCIPVPKRLLDEARARQERATMGGCRDRCPTDRRTEVGCARPEDLARVSGLDGDSYGFRMSVAPTVRDLRVYAQRLPNMGWRGAIWLPTPHGDIAIRAELPSGALHYLATDGVGYHGDDEIGQWWDALLPIAQAAAPIAQQRLSSGQAGQNPLGGLGQLWGALQAGGQGGQGGGAAGALGGLLAGQRSSAPSEAARIPGVLGGASMLASAWQQTLAPRVADIIANALRALAVEASRLAGNPDAAALIERARASSEDNARNALRMLDMLVQPQQ